MADKITVAIRLPYEDAPREITVEENSYSPDLTGVTLVYDSLEVFYPWHRVDWVARPVSND